MSEFYDRMQQTSQRLITQFQQGTVIYNAPGTGGDPFTPATGGEAYPVQAVQASGSRKKTYMDGGYITATDILLVVAPFAVEPTQSGKVSINGVAHQVVMVDNPTIQPDAPLLWFIGCRR